MKVGDRVNHIKDFELVGTITHIDKNLLPVYGVTTCNVLWDGYSETGIHWTNKLVVCNEDY